jgi:LmbE family N-acetylglucosaminyl deacetylase
MTALRRAIRILRYVNETLVLVLQALFPPPGARQPRPAADAPAERGELAASPSGRRPAPVPGGRNAIGPARDLWLLNPKERPMTATSAPASPMTPAVPAGGPLPEARSVLAVTARPGQESANLGGLVYAFRRAGASLGLLCLTRGGASGLNSGCARLEAVRPWELQLAAGILGISWVAVASYPDGGLGRPPAVELAGRVWRAIRQHAPDLLLVPDPVGGDRDDTAVAVAAVAAARHAGVPVVARTWRGRIPTPPGWRRPGRRPPPPRCRTPTRRRPPGSRPRADAPWPAAGRRRAAPRSHRSSRPSRPR